MQLSLQTVEHKSFSIVIILAVALITSACSKPDINSRYEDDFTNIAKFEIQDTVIFQLDAQTTRKPEKADFIGFIEQDNHFYLYNNSNRSFYFYDLNGSFVEKMSLPSKDTSAVDVTLVNVIARDSILIFSRTSNSIYLFTNRMKAETIYPVLSRSNDDPYIQNYSNSFQLVGNKVYLPVLPLERTSKFKSKAIIEFDLSNQQKQYFIPWPENFECYGVKGFHANYTLNTQRNLVVQSFSFDPNIYVYDTQNKSISKHFAATSKAKSIPCYEGGTSTANVITYQLNNSWFNNFVYDQFNDVYFRGITIAMERNESTPLLEATPTINGDNIYNYIIILDSNFNKIGEISGVAIKSGIIPTHDGIYVPNYSYDKNNEDILVLYKYKLIYNE